jgi:hypothetical protein
MFLTHQKLISPQKESLKAIKPHLCHIRSTKPFFIIKRQALLLENSSYVLNILATSN